jgi:hypothetical protein
VLALGYSCGAALAVEYAAAAPGQHLPVPDAIESINPVPYGEQARIVDLRPIRRGTTLSVLVSEEDPIATDGMTLLLDRLRKAGFSADDVLLHVARSHGGFTRRPPGAAELISPRARRVLGSHRRAGRPARASGLTRAHVAAGRRGTPALARPG